MSLVVRSDNEIDSGLSSPACLVIIAELRWDPFVSKARLDKIYFAASITVHSPVSTLQCCPNIETRLVKLLTYLSSRTNQNRFFKLSSEKNNWILLLKKIIKVWFEIFIWNITRNIKRLKVRNLHCFFILLFWFSIIRKIINTDFTDRHWLIVIVLLSARAILLLSFSISYELFLFWEER